MEYMTKETKKTQSKENKKTQSKENKKTQSKENKKTQSKKSKPFETYVIPHEQVMAKETQDAKVPRPGEAGSAGIWNKRKIKGGLFLTKTELIELLDKAETLPRIDYLHGEEYQKYHDVQIEPEPLPVDVPPAIIKEVKARKRSDKKNPTAQIYLPIEYGGRDVLVIALTPEQRYFIERAENRRHALEILNEYPGDDFIVSQTTLRHRLDKFNPICREYTEALPDKLKEYTAAEAEAIKGERLPDGTLLRGPKIGRERVKADPEKYLKNYQKPQKPKAKK